MIVSIYIYQTIKGPGTKNGAYTYILETEINGEIKTLTDSGTLEAMSENKAELTVLLKAMKRLRKECTVQVIGLNNYVRAGIIMWLDSWLEADWKNAKGKEISNKEEWQQIKQFRDRYKMVIFSEQDHSYRNWMKAEAEKVEKKKNEE